MATIDLIVVSSSPPQHSRCDRAGISSSPDLPSPKALVRPKARICTSNTVASISKAAQVPSLTNGVNLLWEIPDDRHQIAAGVAQEHFSNKPTRRKASRKPRAPKDVDTKAEPVPKKPRKPRTKKSDEGVDDEGAQKEKAQRRPRAKRETAENQTKITRPRVTKSSIDSRVDKSGRKKMAEVVSGYFPSLKEPLADSVSKHEESGNDLLLQEAIKRRINWTPPKATANLSDIVKTPTLDGTMLSALAMAENNITKQLDLMSKFGYSKDEERPAAPNWNESVAPRKRKLVELVKTNTSQMISPEKPKVVKKKPRTITELATSAYAVDCESIESLPRAPLLQYFPHKDEASIETRLGTEAGSKGPSKARSRSPVKSSKVSRPKKGTIEAPILLSPGTALKRSAKQEFVFGTSSQLARENSPTLLRDLLKAMQESNKIEDDPFADVEDWQSSASSPSLEKGTGLFKAQRNLWGAASLGVEGEDFLTLDLSGSPDVSAKSHSVPSYQPKVTNEHVMVAESDEWHELDEDNVLDERAVNTTAVPSTHVEPVKVTISLELHDNPARTSEEASTVPITGEVSLSKPPTLPNESRNGHRIEQKPNYSSYATAQLTKEIASYHFKPIKSRDQMIALLERCWEGKQRVALGNLATNVALGSRAAYSTKSDKKVGAATGIPKASRGRPQQDTTRQNSPVKSKIRPKSPTPSDKGNSTTVEAEKPLAIRQTPKKRLKRTTLVEEIYDSDISLTPSPPRRSPSKVHTPPPPLQLSASPDDESPTLLSPTAQQSLLHLHITRAITSAPPSTDPKNPSWHEKILLYDPIVLEDLTVWLNTGALQKVGWDGEVDPKEVKVWCLRKSICCLWRANLRGGVRRRV